MRYQLILLALAAGLFGALEAAYACVCIGGEFDEEQFRKADLVFKGLTISTADERGRTEFEVIRAVKGYPLKKRTIIARDGSCSAWFTQGQEYWVRAFRRDEEYYTSSCSLLDLDEDAIENEREIAKALQGVVTAKSAEAREEAANQIQEALNRRDFIQYVFSYSDVFEPTWERYDSLDPEYWKIIGEHAREWRDFEREALAYDGLIELEPESAVAYELAGRAYNDHGKYGIAIERYEKALHLDEGLLDSRYYLARARLVYSEIFDPIHRDYRDLEFVHLAPQNRPPVGVDFSDVRMKGFAAKGLVLHEARFRRAEIGGADFSYAHLENSNFEEAYLGALDEESGSANLERALLKGAVLEQARFPGAILDRADLRKVRGKGASFDGASLLEADLRNSDFRSATFLSSKLDGARVEGAVFDGVDFRRARLVGVDMSLATTSEANLLGTIVSCSTRLSADVDYEREGIVPIEPVCNSIPQNRNFSNKVWKQQIFSGLDLSGSNFANAEFQQAWFHEARLRGADFSNTSGTRSYAGADLTDATFRGAKRVGSLTGWADSRARMESIPFPALQGVEFSEASLLTEEFISLRNPELGFADLSKSLFKAAHLSCTLDTDWAWLDRRIDEILARSLGADLSVESREEWLEDLGARRKNLQARFKTEGELVAFFVENWPSVTFDESCEKHLGG